MPFVVFLHAPSIQSLRNMEQNISNINHNGNSHRINSVNCMHHWFLIKSIIVCFHVNCFLKHSFFEVLRIHFILMPIRILDPPRKKWIRIQVMNNSLAFLMLKVVSFKNKEILIISLFSSTKIWVLCANFVFNSFWLMFSSFVAYPHCFFG